MKTGIFFYSFWFTLMIVLITGTARISLFCMGYILACFIFLWFGEDMLLKPVRKLLSMWTGLLGYCYLVIMAKCVLQVRQKHPTPKEDNLHFLKTHFKITYHSFIHS